MSDFETMADVLERVGNVPPERVRMRPLPGRATEQDIVALHDHEDRLCELIDGILVEKSYHFFESVLNVALTSRIIGFEEEANLGFALGTTAAYRIRSGRVRLPDVSFIRWERVPDRRVPDVEIGDFAPDLVCELNNSGNTAAETAMKINDYFAMGTRLMWVADIDARTVEVYTDADQFTRLDESQTLDGDPVLPGFTLSIRRWFERVARSV